MTALWRRHVFVCCNERPEDHPRPCCAARGGEQILAWFKQDVTAAKLKRDVRVSRSGCLEGCESGPSVVVYPEAVWYTVRGRDDVARIVREHLRDGRPVADLLMDFEPLPAWRARRQTT